jgi:transposase
MFRRKDRDQQSSIWIPTSDIRSTPANTFYQKLDRALSNSGFGDAVRALCAPFYASDLSRGGRPGIDPEVYFKMQIIGFFENLASERAIAARCADSLSIREFLHYELHERTPEHSSLTVIRQRLNADVYEQMFGLVLKALKQHKLLKGKRLGIDASVMEANASLRSLEHRLTGDAYAEYVRKLAEAAGVDTADAAAVRRFDKKRAGRKTSNAEWQNPHDPDAKVGRTKRGATRMIYKPEHVVDLETGAIVNADVRPGDEHDTADLTSRVVEAEVRMNRALGEPENTQCAQTVAADMGYFKVEEIAQLQDLEFETIIRDPLRNRRIDKLTEAERVALQVAKHSVMSPSGTALLKLRAEFVERSFQHVLDCGGARRTTVRGRDNIRKLYLIRAAGANLSLLMRRIIGFGTPKQALAASTTAIAAALCLWLALLRSYRDRIRAAWRSECLVHANIS